MNLKELEKLLTVKDENEILEFKESRGQFSILGKTEKGKNSKKSIYAYCVAIGNEGGGKLIFGVKDKINSITGKRDIVGTSAIQNIKKAKEQIYQKLNRKINIVEIFENDKKIQIVEIPSRPVSDTFNFYGIPLMRNGENLIEMNKNALRDILNEKQNDYSLEICNGITIDDLDVGAMELLKQKWAKKSTNKEFLKLENSQMLDKLLLKIDNKITNAGALLLAREDILTRHLSNSEFIIEWRSEEKLNVDFRANIRKPFILAFDEIWTIINARNIRTPFKQGFIELDIWAYDEASVREGLLNAFAHREYFNRIESIFIKFNPNSINIKSPGGFVNGVTTENALFIEGKWRNRFLMEILEKVGLVERAGIGLDRIFEEAIKNGKGLPVLENNNSVTLNMPAKVKDISFVYFLEKISKEKQTNFNVKDFLVLENIRENGTSTDKERVKFFIENNIIEKIGKTSGIKYLLSKNFYEFINEKSEYTRKKWLSKEQQKQVLLNYFKQHKKGKMREFKSLFESKLTKPKINKLLSELKRDNLIYLDGNPQSTKTFWKLREK